MEKCASAFFVEHFAAIGALYSAAVGFAACWLFEVRWDGRIGYYARQVVFNGVACGFGWLAIAVFWRRHCWPGPCGFADLDFADFVLGLVAFLGLTCLLPLYVSTALEIAGKYLAHLLKKNVPADLPE